MEEKGRGSSLGVDNSGNAARAQFPVTQRDSITSKWKAYVLLSVIFGRRRQISASFLRSPEERLATEPERVPIIIVHSNRPHHTTRRLERTLVRVLVLKHEGYRHEHEVQQEHGEAETLIHAPAEARNGHDDEKQHHEEDGD